ncbi:MAG: SIS domain-containing protein [Candidatus Omnitrophica bacterium]|nr:SIS domain-containing protein [Candidatus Omnitrophota bacterium]
MQGYAEKYLDEAKQIAGRIDAAAVESLARLIAGIRDGGGRLFFVGVGGGAAHASHAVNDFRKICAMECYTPADNVAEWTARINDDGWEDSLSGWLKGSRLSSRDLVFVFSVGGGDLEKKVSANIVKALELAKKTGARVAGVVGRDGGYTAKVADACVVVPVVNPETVTPHTEAFQAVVWHLLVSHPLLQKNEMKWESVK